MEVDLAGNIVLKILTFSLIALMFLFTFSLMNACKAAGSSTGEASGIEIGDERVAEESMKDAEDEDMEDEEAKERYKLKDRGDEMQI